MSEAALWLNCALAAAIAFLLTGWQAWRIVPAIFAATAAALALFLIGEVARDGPLDRFLLEPVLLTVGSWSVIFAGVGTAAGLAYRHARQKP